MVSDAGVVTRLLRLAAAGDLAAFDKAFAFVYADLQRAARAQLRREVEGHTLDTGALVHEAWLRLRGNSDAAFEDRAHFLAIAATAMRRILVEHARRVRADKRGGGVRPITLDTVTEQVAAGTDGDVLIALDDALARLADLDPRQARVVDCRWFGGLTEDETAIALGVSVRTVKRDWARARAWLHAALDAGAAT